MEDESSYFKHVVIEALHDLEKSSSAYCFSIQQVEAIQEKVDCYVYKVEDGIYYLRKGDDPRK